MSNNDNEILLALTKKATMGDMLGMIVHQWKQPLSMISILSTNMDLQLELNNFNQDKFLTYNKQIKEQIDYMSEIIDDFKNFFSEDRVKNTVNIKTCIEKAIKFTKIALEKSDINFIVDISSEYFNILAYNNDVCQILIILITNAKEKLSKLSIQNKTIILSLFEKDSNLIISVSDNGGHIDENIIHSIFDENFTTKIDKAGNGLGLYIAKKITTEHLHGEIFVQNENDKSKVSFILSIPKDL